MVHESEIHPNCLGSMAFSRVYFISCSITHASAIFDSVDVSEMGRKSVLKSSTVDSFGSVLHWPISMPQELYIHKGTN